MGGSRGNEHYTKKAKKEGYLARSAYKLMELDQKFHLLDDSHKILDIGCAPGSRLQYMSQQVSAGKPAPSGAGIRDKGSQHTPLLQGEVGGGVIIGLDLKKVDITLPYVHSYQQDICDRASVGHIFEAHDINDSNDAHKFDLIVSDMAPDTMGMADIDALRCIGLLEKTLWIYDTYLKEGGQFAIKIFMGPGYDEFVNNLRDIYSRKEIVTFKPKSCRPKSKEIYVVKRKV